MFELQVISGLLARNRGTGISDMYLLPTRKTTLRRGLCCIICAFFSPPSFLDGSRMLEALVLMSVGGVVCTIVRFFQRNIDIDGG